MNLYFLFVVSVHCIDIQAMNVPEQNGPARWEMCTFEGMELPLTRKEKTKLP